MNLLRSGNFTLSSGQRSSWKIDCDAFTEADWNTCALMVVESGIAFSKVVPVPKGKSDSNVDNALRFSEALDRFVDSKSSITLFVDDVYTTGASIRKCLHNNYTTMKFGIVVFARKPIVPVDKHWVYPLFQVMV